MGFHPQVTVWSKHIREVSGHYRIQPAWSGGVSVTVGVCRIVQFFEVSTVIIEFTYSRHQRWLSFGNSLACLLVELCAWDSLSRRPTSFQKNLPNAFCFPLMVWSSLSHSKKLPIAHLWMLIFRSQARRRVCMNSKPTPSKLANLARMSREE